MHDLDVTRLADELGEFESEFETDLFDEEEAEFEFEADDDSDEMELAAELLTVSSDEELEQFLGKLIGSATKAARGFLRSSTGKAVGRALKGMAKKALPVAGRAAFSAIGLPENLGGQLGQAAGGLFGLELEGLSPEDQEFEVARRFVRFGRSAASNAASLASRVPAGQAVNTALQKAALQHAPGMLRGGRTRRGGAGAGRRNRGNWVRRGNAVILIGT